MAIFVKTESEIFLTNKIRNPKKSAVKRLYICVSDLFNLNAIIFITEGVNTIIIFILMLCTIGVKEHAFFMKEVDDGVKVQKRILERLEAASAILFARQKRLERNIQQSIGKNDGKLETLTPDQIESINTALAEEKAIKINEDLEISRLLHWIVVGAGPTGVELCAEMSDFVR
jgi:hypothetical protein